MTVTLFRVRNAERSLEISEKIGEHARGFVADDANLTLPRAAINWALSVARTATMLVS